MATTEAQVRAAKGPPEALLAIAVAIDSIIDSIKALKAEDPDPWSDWDFSRPVAPTGSAFTIEDDGGTVDIKAVSPEQKAARLKFAESHLRLEEAFPGIDAVQSYVKGGPVWLYEYNRDYLLQLPHATRQMLIADINLVDPQVAIEMGRDLLMDRGQGEAPAWGGEPV